MMHSDQWQQHANHQAQQNLLQQLTQALHQFGHSPPTAGYGQGWLGQAAYGPGVFGQGGYGPGQFGAAYGWGGASSQRQLSPQDVSAILQQVAPILPQIVAQAQQQPYYPQAAFGAGFGGHQRPLSQQDVNEVVRQLLPMLPQLMQSAQAPAWQAGLSPVGFGQAGGFNQPYMGWGQAAYGATPPFNPLAQNQGRQLTPQDAAEIARQLAEIIPQTIGAQPFAQQRM